MKTATITTPEGTFPCTPHRASIFTVEQEAELRRIKAYFPFRIVYGAVNAHTGEFVSGAVYDMRKPNHYARKDGWLVATIQNA